MSENLTLWEEPRPRNEVWDALAELFGEPTTESNRKLRGRLVRSLRSAGADYPTIMERAMSWPFHFPGATLTATALEKHWDQLARPPLRFSDSEQRRLTQAMELRELERRIDDRR